MQYAVVAVVALWLAVVISRPRRPISDNETAWIVYARLDGAHGRLFLLAVVCSLALLLGGVAAAANERNGALARMRNPCAVEHEHAEMCWRLNDDGTWSWRPT